uniref:Uncharacterized protein n=1 Tax=Triticum urartu TaxID=4572 RepID=A0A8R7QCC3_TRIUA
MRPPFSRLCSMSTDVPPPLAFIAFSASAAPFPDPAASSVSLSRRPSRSTDDSDDMPSSPALAALSREDSDRRSMAGLDWVSSQSTVLLALSKPSWSCSAKKSRATSRESRIRRSRTPCAVRILLCRSVLNGLFLALACPVPAACTAPVLASFAGGISTRGGAGGRGLMSTASSVSELNWLPWPGKKWS